MILVIDTSSSTAVVVELNQSVNEMHCSSRSDVLMPALQRVVRLSTDVEKIAVAVGPGSFTGLRVGVSFALGIAVGRRIPIVPLGSLELQAARSDEPVTAVVEAGRGRFYFKAGDGPHGLGSPAEIPKALELVGNLSDEGSAALTAAGHGLISAGRLRPTGAAAQKLLETAPEVAYGSLEIEYMQTFSARTG